MPKPDSPTISTVHAISGLEGVEPAAVAETVPGESTEIFCKLANELDIYLTVPLLEKDEKTGKNYNTSV